MAQKQIDSLQLVGERVLVERTLKPKHSTILLPNGAPSPDLFNITDKCLKFSVSAQKALQEEGIDLPVGKKPYFASHMQPETILEESEMDEKEGGIAYIVVNYRHIVDYDLSS